MTPDQAEALAARTLAAMEAKARDASRRNSLGPRRLATFAADRERVASDLAGLRDVWGGSTLVCGVDARHARRYAEGLRRTARLYGVEA